MLMRFDKQFILQFILDSQLSFFKQFILDSQLSFLRSAARLNPFLKVYYQGLPRNMIHYEGYVTRTEENWPLIGATPIEVYFINGAMSGFGTMAACGAGEIIGKNLLQRKLPSFSADLSLQCYQNKSLMTELQDFDAGFL